MCGLALGQNLTVYQPILVTNGKFDSGNSAGKPNKYVQAALPHAAGFASMDVYLLRIPIQNANFRGKTPLPHYVMKI